MACPAVVPAAAVDPQNPWLGLASFTEETRAFFFGRDDEVAELARRVQRKPLTVLFGQSGLGKTSMLRAGLVPKLRPEGFCPIYLRLDHSPASPSPSGQIKQAVLRASEALGTWSRPGAARDGESLWEFFHHRDDVLRDPDDRVLTPLLIFDQFEEIFTLAQTDEAGRARAHDFLRELADLVENRAPSAIEDDEASAERFDFARADYRVLIALREDYLAHLESLRDAMPSVTQNRVRLTRMTGGPALEAVVRPGGGLVSDDVARQIVRFVSGARDLATAEIEPSLLSLVCRELNEMRLARDEPAISAELLAGSRDTILAEFYRRSLADQPEGVRRFVEDELLTDSGFRESLAEERARKACAEAGAPGALAVLVDRRLLRIEERLDVRRVELTHDVLCSVVKASRDTRREREAKERAERELARTRANEAATHRALWRARVVASGCAALAVCAVAAASWGYVNLRRARAAEAQAAGTRALADQARLKAQQLVTFLNRDLAQRLQDVGQMPLLREVSERTVRFFDGLPPDFMTHETRADHALALTVLGSVLGAQTKEDAAGAEIERALGIFDRLQREEPLTPDQLVDRATARLAWGVHLIVGQDFKGGAEIAARVADEVEPLVDDSTTGRRAEDLRVEALFRDGLYTAWSGDGAAGLARLEKALAAARRQDARPIPPERPGLAAAEIETFLCQYYSYTSERGRARELGAEAVTVLQGYVEREPQLQRAHEGLARASARMAELAVQDGETGTARRLLATAIPAHEQFLRADPKSVWLRNGLIEDHVLVLALTWLDHDFAAGRNHARAALDLVSTPDGVRLTNQTFVDAAGRAAWAAAAAGDDAAADAFLAEAETLTQELNDTVVNAPAAQLLHLELLAYHEMLTRREQGRWRGLRALAEREIARLAGKPGLVPMSGIDATLLAQFMRAFAAWATGDLAAASESITKAGTCDVRYLDTPSFAEDLRNLDVEAWSIAILLDTGRGTEAQPFFDPFEKALARCQAKHADLAGVQSVAAHVHWVRAVGDRRLDAPARRRLLDQAIGELQTLHDAGRIRRLDREFLLPRLEAALAALPPP